MKNLLTVVCLLVCITAYGQTEDDGIVLHGDSTFTAKVSLLKKYRKLQVEVDGCRERETNVIQKGIRADERERQLDKRQEATKGEEEKQRKNRFVNTLSKVVAVASTFALVYTTIVK